ncbi:hypothetical protein [Nocardia sp. NPDC049707]|uniref:hypothetical protein n=1 Tax=Nocardia sp. NPDC049707 TaxID=3154735 RepID=UPI0034416A63
MAETLCRTVVEQPLFCDLLAHAPLNLERHVSMESVRAYKISALAAVAELAETSARALPALSKEAAWELISAVSVLAGALWQIAHPPETLARLYEQEPQLAHAAVDLLPHLTKTIRATTRGLIT